MHLWSPNIFKMGFFDFFSRRSGIWHCIPVSMAAYLRLWVGAVSFHGALHSVMAADTAHIMARSAQQGPCGKKYLSPGRCLAAMKVSSRLACGRLLDMVTKARGRLWSLVELEDPKLLTFIAEVGRCQSSIVSMPTEKLDSLPTVVLHAAVVR